jgi:hypothetical protein
MMKRTPWLIQIAEHDLFPRFHVPASESRTWGLTAGAAKLTAIRYAHADNGIPPLKSMVRATAKHTTASEIIPQPWERT